MVIYDLNILRARFSPPEADAPLIVDTNAMLTDAVASMFEKRLMRTL